MMVPSLGFDWQLVKATFSRGRIFSGSFIALLVAVAQIWTIIDRSYQEARRLRKLF
ncbi:MAG TPA: hypothetical protein VKO42_04975 [Patescibacteria group bacterium]|nr:hypothetical protein [Patescibacteria group bacterium]